MVSHSFCSPAYFYKSFLVEKTCEASLSAQISALYIFSLVFQVKNRVFLTVYKSEANLGGVAVHQ